MTRRPDASDLSALLAELESRWDRQCVACGKAPAVLGLMVCQPCWDERQPKRKAGA